MKDLFTDVLAALERGDPHYRNAVTRLRFAADAAIDAGQRFDNLRSISERQFEATLLSARGYSDREAGRASDVAQSCAGAARRRAFAFLGVDSPAQVAVLAYRAGLLGDGEP